MFSVDAEAIVSCIKICSCNTKSDIDFGEITKRAVGLGHYDS